MDKKCTEKHLKKDDQILWRTKSTCEKQVIFDYLKKYETFPQKRCRIWNKTLKFHHQMYNPTNRETVYQKYDKKQVREAIDKNETVLLPISDFGIEYYRKPGMGDLNQDVRVESSWTFLEVNYTVRITDSS